MTTVLLVDDHAVVREGFRQLLERRADFQVVAEAANATDALAALRRQSPDIALVDLSLGGGSGLELLPLLSALAPNMKRVVLSMHDDPGMVFRAMQAGADAYLTKSVAAEEMLGLLQRVMAGEKVLSSDLALRPDCLHSRPALSPRELDTLRGLLSGKPPKAIAVELGISDKTLYRHRANLMEKLGARTVADLARISREQGWLLPP